MSGSDKGFDSFNEFVEYVRRGCEIEFEYGGQRYFIAHGDMIYVYRILDDVCSDEDMFEYCNAETIGGYIIKGETLKDIIVRLKVIDRSF